MAHEFCSTTKPAAFTSARSATEANGRSRAGLLPLPEAIAALYDQINTLQVAIHTLADGLAPILGSGADVVDEPKTTGEPDPPYGQHSIAICRSTDRIIELRELVESLRARLLV